MSALFTLPRPSSAALLNNHTPPVTVAHLSPPSIQAAMQDWIDATQARGCLHVDLKPVRDPQACPLHRGATLGFRGTVRWTFDLIVPTSTSLLLVFADGLPLRRARC